MRKLPVVVAAMMLSVGLLSATPVCTSANVLSLGQCNFGGLIFDNWTVSTTNLTDTTVSLSTLSNVSGGSVNLAFTVVHSPSPTVGQADILLGYSVSSGIMGLDMYLGSHSPIGGVTITESACDAAFIQNGCGTLLAAFSVSSPGAAYNSATFSPTDTVWITKDIQLQNGATLSDFVNSHEVPVPEPVTYMLMGSGLLALGLLRRKAHRS